MILGLIISAVFVKKLNIKPMNNTEKTPVETYAVEVLNLIIAYGKKQINDDQLVIQVLQLKNECLDAEKRAHQLWFNKGFEFYREQHLLTQLES